MGDWSAMAEPTTMTKRSEPLGLSHAAAVLYKFCSWSTSVSDASLSAQKTLTGLRRAEYGADPAILGKGRNGEWRLAVSDGLSVQRTAANAYDVVLSACSAPTTRSIATEGLYMRTEGDHRNRLAATGHLGIAYDAPTDLTKLTEHDELLMARPSSSTRGNCRVTYTGDDPVNNDDPSGLACGQGIGSYLDPFESGSCFKSGWDSLSGKEQLADATLPITLPLAGLAVVSGAAEAAGGSVFGLGEAGTSAVALGSGISSSGIDSLECLKLHDSAACIGAAISGLSTGGSILGLSLGAESLAGGLFGAFGLSTGITGVTWDLLNIFRTFEEGNRLSGLSESPCAPATR
jgi:hypothetical protein